MKSPGSSDTTPHVALVATLQEFTTKGHTDARLDVIVVALGVSKRMFYYYRGDKLGLYRATWAHALETVRPDDDVLRPYSNVSVEALQHIVGTVYDYFSVNSLVVRLIIQENSHSVLPLEGVTGLDDQSPIVLEFDRILLLGRDYGTFRVDISTLDLYILMPLLATFLTLYRRTLEDLYGIEVQPTVPSDKLREFAQDIVISPLMSSPRSEPDSLYTSLLAFHSTNSPAFDAEVYGDQSSPETQDLTADGAPDYCDIYGMDDQGSIQTSGTRLEWLP